MAAKVSTMREPVNRINQMRTEKMVGTIVRNDEVVGSIPTSSTNSFCIFFSLRIPGGRFHAHSLNNRMPLAMYFSSP